MKFYAFSGGSEWEAVGSTSEAQTFYLFDFAIETSTSINFILNHHRGTKSATKQHAKERIDENDSHESGRGSDVGQLFQTRLDAFARDTMYARYGVVMRRLRGNDETLSETTSRERAKVGEGQR